MRALEWVPPYFRWKPDRRTSQVTDYEQRQSSTYWGNGYIIGIWIILDLKDEEYN